LAEEKRKRTEELVKKLCERGGAVLLFGSRARGEAHLLSDWNLALIVAEGEYRVESTGVGQLFIIPLDKLDDILEFSMVVRHIRRRGIALWRRVVVQVGAGEVQALRRGEEACEN